MKQKETQNIYTHIGSHTCELCVQAVCELCLARHFVFWQSICICRLYMRKMLVLREKRNDDEAAHFGFRSAPVHSHHTQ